MITVILHLLCYKIQAILWHCKCQAEHIL
jgi:hypothetical protein